MSEVTQLLEAIRSGDAAATAQLFPLIYNELRGLARARMAQERGDHTLQATALVHEAYLRLVGDADPRWEGRRHFFGAAAEAMRRILIDHARAKKTAKRRGDGERVELESACVVEEPPSVDLLELDEALSKLSTVDPSKAELVKLRFFAGMTMPEAAAALGVSLATAERYWTFARTWLYAEMADSRAHPP